jgi:hypothetical protein
MTPSAFCTALSRLGLTVRAAAAWYGTNKMTIGRWRDSGPTPPAARLTRLALALLERGWSRAEIDALLSSPE